MGFSPFLEILEIIGPALWILPTVYLFFLMWRRQEENKFRIERDRLYQEREMREYEQHRLARGSDRDERYNPRILEELASRVSRLDATIAERLDLGFSAQLDHILASVTKAVGNRSAPRRGQDDHEVVRDLSHALNTPLSQIEAATSTALSRSGIDQDQRESMESIRASVQICKAFLGAYRELNSVSASSSVWSPNSLQEALRSAGEVYSARIGKSPKLNVNLPASIDGYSNNYVAALLLPILENAIESSRPETRVNVGFRESPDQIDLTVVNEPEEEPGGDDIYELGHTTKQGHDGIGLSSVQYLLSGHRDSAVRHSYASPHATFSVTLPRRES